MYLVSTTKGSVSVLAAGAGHIMTVPLLLLPPPELLLLPEELLLLPDPLLELLLPVPELLPELELLELVPGLDDAAHALHARSGKRNQAETGACAMRAYDGT
jgi:hypothetical protein